MSASLAIVSGPPSGAEILTLAEAKAHLRVDHATEDALIARLLAAAREHLEGPEGVLGRTILQQTLELRLDAWPRHGIILLPLPPALSIVSVKYIDPDGAEQTVSGATYTLSTAHAPARLYPAWDQDWPAARAEPGAVRIRWLAGYAPGAGSPTDYAANVPARLKQAVALLVAHMYEHRETEIVGASITELPTFARLIAPLRIQNEIEVG